ncbi:MAG TPA: hypothetical protein VNT79_11290 [Phycisphaerae bacterium]|nr:hypothetical protein [Phycisphaerae bacterium]
MNRFSPRVSNIQVVMVTFGVCLIVLMPMRQSEAAFDVSMWNLSTRLSQQTDAGQISDSVDIFELSNPLSQTARAELTNSFNESQFAYHWLTEEATGQFHTAVTHGHRDPEMRTVSDGRMHILADEPLHVLLSGSLTYAHIPGDIVGINFNARLRNLDSGQDVFLDLHRGGNLYFEPSSGILTMSNSAILDPGIPYELRYVVDSSNTGDLLPTGPVDASGWVEWSIQPVPETSTLFMLLAALILCPRHARARQ